MLLNKKILWLENSHRAMIRQAKKNPSPSTTELAQKGSRLPRAELPFRDNFLSLQKTSLNINNGSRRDETTVWAPWWKLWCIFVKTFNLNLIKTRGLTGIPRWLSGKESACSAGDTGLIPGSGRSPGRGNGNLPQHSCLGNPMDRGAWRATVHGVMKTWVSTHMHRSSYWFTRAEKYLKVIQCKSANPDCKQLYRRRTVSATNEHQGNKGGGEGGR